MPYTPQTWTDGVSKLNATRMGHIETGIDDATTTADAAIPESLVDAKGDLLVGTAADTVGRLAVGADNKVVVASSGQSTGLAYSFVTNSMVDAAAAIAASKLASYPSDSTKYLRGDGTWPVLPFQQISDTTLSVTTANFDITSIPGTFNHLRLVLYVRSTEAATLSVVTIRFNNDSASNYDYQQVRGSASTADSTEVITTSGGKLGNCPGNTAGANLFGVSVAEIPFYAGTSNNKTCVANWTRKSGTTSGSLDTGTVGSNWRSSSAITRITVLPASGSWAAGSRATLYGLL